METIDRQVLTFLLNSLWQVTLVAAVAAVACRSMRNGPAGHRHAVCVAALIAALLLPAASLRRAAGGPPTIAVPQQVAIWPGTTATASVINPAADAPARNVPVPGPAAAALLWALGGFLVFRCARLARAALRTAKICRSATVASEDCPVWDRAKHAFGLTGIELRWSFSISGPVTAGKIVILPAAMQSASDEVLAAAIGHELAHIARRDFAANVLCELLSLPISFHPATAFLRREIDRTRELACDELVTTVLLEPGRYAQSIVDIAATMSGLPRPGYTLGVFDGDILEERIRRLVERPVANLKRARLLLGAGLAGLALCAAVASGLAISARAQTAAQSELRTAADAYNAGDFASAVAHFEKAVALEPDSIKARLFLAGAYLREDPNALASKARAQYLEVLRLDPKNVVAMFGLVSVNGAPNLAESRTLMLKAIELDPKRKEAYYSAGVVDWMLAYPAIVKANSGAGPEMYRQIANPAERAALRAQYLPYIDEGLRLLQIALSLDPQFSDAMAYLNLLTRLKAPLMDDSAQSADLLVQADEWVGRAIKAKRGHPAAAPSDRIDPDGPAPTAIPSLMPPPPPPPPPPGGYRGNGDRN